MKTMNFNRPAFCLTLPVNTSRYSSVYKNYIKEGKWEEVETSSPFYSMAVEEYLACKQAGVTCEIKSIPKPQTERGKKNLKMILNRLDAEESDLWDRVPELEDKSANADATKIKAVKKELEEALKAPITQEEREMANIVSQVVATDDNTANEMYKMSKILDISVPDLFVAAIRAGELGCTHEEAVAIYTLSKKYSNLLNISDMLKAYVLGDADSDELAAIISQTQIDLFNAMSKDDVALGVDDLKLAELVLNKDCVDKLRNKPIIVADTTATEQPVNQAPDQLIEQKEADQSKQPEQEKQQEKQPEQEKQPAVQADSNSKSGEKPVQAGPAEPDRENGFVNHNMPTLNKYSGCIDVVNFASSLGYTTKLTDRGDGFVTAEIFAKGIQDPISKLIIDPGVLYPAAMGYAIMIPDSGTPFAPSFTDMIMSDYVYINDQQEQQQLSWMVAGNQPTRMWLDDLRSNCSIGKKMNAIIEYSSLPLQSMDQVTQFLLEQLSNKLFEKGVRLRGHVIEIQPNSVKVGFKSNAGPLRRYYQNKKYGDIVITVSLDSNNNNKVLFNVSNVSGNKKSVAKLNKLLG